MFTRAETELDHELQSLILDLPRYPFVCQSRDFQIFWVGSFVPSNVLLFLSSLYISSYGKVLVLLSELSGPLGSRSDQYLQVYPDLLELYSQKQTSEILVSQSESGVCCFAIICGTAHQLNPF